MAERIFVFFRSAETAVCRSWEASPGLDNIEDVGLGVGVGSGGGPGGRLSGGWTVWAETPAGRRVDGAEHLTHLGGDQAGAEATAHGLGGLGSQGREQDGERGNWARVIADVAGQGGQAGPDQLRLFDP